MKRVSLDRAAWRFNLMALASAGAMLVGGCHANDLRVILKQFTELAAMFAFWLLNGLQLVYALLVRAFVLSI